MWRDSESSGGAQDQEPEVKCCTSEKDLATEDYNVTRWIEAIRSRGTTGGR